MPAALSENDSRLETLPIPPKSLAEYKRAQQALRAKQDEWVKQRAKFRVGLEHGKDGAPDLEAQALVLRLCHLDPLFWFDWFACIYDPRATSDRKWVPFILFQYQREFILWLLANVMACLGTIERRNLLVEKSRDMGVSWLVYHFAWWLCFFRNEDVLIGSRNEDELDKKGDLTTPFEKLRRIHEIQPSWFINSRFDPRNHQKQMLLVNPSGGQIKGELSTQAYGRGGRFGLNVFEEFPTWENDAEAWDSSSQSSPCRLVIGTADGINNKHYRLRSQMDGERCDVKRLHWLVSPLKASGKFKDAEGNWSSPWYEMQKDTMSPENVAAELDISYERSTRARVFKTYISEFHGQTDVDLRPGRTVVILDPGVNCFGVLWLHFEEKTGRIVATRRIVQEDARIRDVGEKIVRINQDLKDLYPYYDWYLEYTGDPMGVKRGNAASEDAEYQILADEFGIYVDYFMFEEMPTPNRKKNRITAINEMLSDVIKVGHQASPRLVVDTKHCKELHEALESGYKYQTDKHGRPTEQIARCHPFEDMVDCLGYGIIYRLGVNPKSRKKASVEIEDGGFQWDGMSRRSA